MNADNGTVILLDLLLTLRQDRCKRGVEIGFQTGLIAHSIYPLSKRGGNPPSPSKYIARHLSLSNPQSPCRTILGNPLGPRGDHAAAQPAEDHLRGEAVELFKEATRHWPKRWC